MFLRECVKWRNTSGMQIYLTEHMKVERVESGVAVVTLRIPIEYLDSLLALADHLISCARFLKTRSRVALATDAANSPGHAALVLAARAAAVRAESDKRQARRIAAKSRVSDK